VIPAFTNLGTLPPGEHPITWVELLELFGQTPHRAMLLGGLRAGLEPLRLAGSHRVWLDGSFITNKEKPGDIDVAYDDARLDWELLQRLEPTLLDLANARAAQKRKFNCEFFAVSWAAEPEGTSFLDFFQRDRNGQPKGILVLELENLEPGGNR
jgi:hypothetical protein